MNVDVTRNECVEHAVLCVSEDQVDEFEVAFAAARPLIEVQPGFRWMRLVRVIETAGTYVLLVGWETLEAHTEGFRRSPEYERWRALLHHFYDPFPTVTHGYDIV